MALIHWHTFVGCLLLLSILASLVFASNIDSEELPLDCTTLLTSITFSIHLQTTYLLPLPSYSHLRISASLILLSNVITSRLSDTTDRL